MVMTGVITLVAKAVTLKAMFLRVGDRAFEVCVPSGFILVARGLTSRSNTVSRVASLYKNLLQQLI